MDRLKEGRIGGWLEGQLMDGWVNRIDERWMKGKTGQMHRGVMDDGWIEGRKERC